MWLLGANRHWGDLEAGTLWHFQRFDLFSDFVGDFVGGQSPSGDLLVLGAVVGEAGVAEGPFQNEQDVACGGLKVNLALEHSLNKAFLSLFDMGIDEDGFGWGGGVFHRGWLKGSVRNAHRLPVKNINKAIPRSPELVEGQSGMATFYTPFFGLGKGEMPSPFFGELSKPIR